MIPSLAKTRLARLPLLGVLGLGLLGACAVTPGSESTGDVGETTAAIDHSGVCNRTQILASVSGSRHTAITRGFHWYDQHVPYSQAATHEGYRTDCSGFVSMCWHLGQSFTTADFYSGGGDSGPLGSYDQLLPGDALVHRSGGAGHIVLFLGWTSSSRTSACVLEEANSASDMQFRARTTSSLHSGGYKAIRADGMGSVATPDPTPDPTPTPTPTPSPTPTPDPTPDPTPTPTPDAGGGGASCAGDGDCNPGNDGSGQICSSGQCVPGCHKDNQCPGVTVCVAGQCQ